MNRRVRLHLETFRRDKTISIKNALKINDKVVCRRRKDRLQRFDDCVLSAISAKYKSIDIAEYFGLRVARIRIKETP